MFQIWLGAIGTSHKWKKIAFLYHTTSAHYAQAGVWNYPDQLSVMALTFHPSQSTHWGWDKRATISQTTFSNTFSQWKCMNIDQDFTEVCSLGSNWQDAIIGSDNGLAPNRRWAIICTNDGLGLQCIYASLGLNELTHFPGRVTTNRNSPQIFKGILLFSLSVANEIEQIHL